jgi:glycerol kinase
VGYWKSTDDVKANWEIERKFEPNMSDKDRDHRRSRWNEALRRACEWEERSTVDVKKTL